MDVPYSYTTSGLKARDEIVRLLQKFGCDAVGFMDNFSEQTVILQFKYRNRSCTMSASANGWAQMYLREHPWNTKRKLSKQEYTEKAVAQGLISVNSMLRDWVKGSLTAVECGMIDFDSAFLPYMLTSSGRTVAEVVLDPSSGLLPAPTTEGDHGR